MWWRKKKRERKTKIIGYTREDKNKDINDLIDKINEVLDRPEHRDRRVIKLKKIFK